MAGKDRRAAIGAAGTQTTEDREPPKPAREKRHTAQRDAREQAKILRPERLHLTLALDGKKRKFSLPSEFTIGQIERGVYEDIGFTHGLWQMELARLAPEMQSEGTDFLRRYPRYSELAFLRSNVRTSMRDLIARLGQFDDVERDENDRPVAPLRATVKQIEDGVNELEYLLAAMWIFGQFNRARENAAKNVQRTAQA